LYLARAQLTADQSTAEDLDRFATAIFGAPAAELPALFSSGPTGPNNAFSYLEYDQLKDSTGAIFGEYTRKLSEHTTAVVGLRLGRNAYTFSSLQQGAFAPGGRTVVQGSKRDDSVLPKLSISHALGAADMVYATAASGDRPGGGNPALSGYIACQPDLAALGIREVKPTYDADKLWSYELGYKGRALNKTLEVAASLFYIDWQKIQTRITLPTCQFGFMANAGQARSTGADIQLQWRLSRQWSLSASASITDAKYQKTVFADGSDNGAGSPIVRAGQALPVPRVNGNLGLEYSWLPMAGQRAFVRSDLQYAGRYHRTGGPGAYDHDAATYEAPATQYLSLNAGLSSGAFDWSLSVLNLTNARPQLLRFRYTPSDPSLQATTFRPRTLQASLSYKF
jgi:outer membrane receptor protein involved in Fe transport